MRWLILLAPLTLVALTGCATPPGKLSDADFDYETYFVSLPSSKVYAGLQNNARHCGGLIDGYEPKWYPSQDMLSAKIDLYLKGGFGGVSEWVAGVIEMSQKDDGTVIKVGIQKTYSNPVFGKNGWWKSKFSRITKEIGEGQPPSCN